MEALELVKNESTQVIFSSSNKTLILKLKGIVSKNHLKSLRSHVNGMIESLGAQQLVMNTSDSEYQEFDFADDERKTFYKEAEENGVKNLVIVYPNENFLQEILNQWNVFFSSNEINIKVSAQVS